MPFYEYECQSCKYYTEVMQKISDPPLRKCPSCSKLQLKKLVSAPVFRLKGGGWYETDFKSDKESKRNLAGAERDDSSASSDSKPVDTKTTDSKPAEAKKPETKPAAAAETGSGSGKRSSSAAKAPSRTAAARAKPKTASKAKSKSPVRKARR